MSKNQYNPDYKDEPEILRRSISDLLECNENADEENQQLQARINKAIAICNDLLTGVCPIEVEHIKEALEGTE